MALVTLDAAKAQLNATNVGAIDEVQLQLYIDAVTKPIEDACGRTIDARSFTQVMTVNGAAAVVLRRVPVIEVTAVATQDASQTWDPGDLYVDPDTGVVTVKSGPAFSGDVAFVYVAGENPVTANHQLAALITIEHLWETKRGTMTVGLGGDMEPWTPGMGFALPHRAVQLLGTPLPGIA
jgi:hypothetical protein